MPIAGAFAPDPHGQTRSAQTPTRGEGEVWWFEDYSEFLICMLDRWPEGHGSVCEQRNAAVVGTVLEERRGRGRGGGREGDFICVGFAGASDTAWSEVGGAETAAIFRPGTD